MPSSGGGWISHCLPISRFASKSVATEGVTTFSSSSPTVRTSGGKSGAISAPRLTGKTWSFRRATSPLHGVPPAIIGSAGPMALNWSLRATAMEAPEPSPSAICGSFLCRESPPQRSHRSDRENLALEALAKTAQRGAYPRSFIGEQLYWTLAGSDGHGIASLIDEDAAIEFQKGGFSVAPVVVDGGTTFSWANVTATQQLAEGQLPNSFRPMVDAPVRARDHSARGLCRPGSVRSLTLTNRARSRRVLELRLRLRPGRLIRPPSSFRKKAAQVRSLPLSDPVTF